MRADHMEKIVAAAVRYEGMVFSLIPPARHGECLCLLRACRPDSTGGEDQGFVTSHHRYVDRIEARAIATAAGQLTARDSRLPELFSEDVW